jgi:Na+-translocating ferredoxin:NAD+ oxidoreductase RnfD subunit
MSVTGILIGVLNCVLVAAVLVLIGAIIVWVANIFEWPIPWNIQRIYLLIVLVVFIICVVSLLVGAPMVHFFGSMDGVPRPRFG